MVERIQHRGPDDSGIWTSSDRTVGFGHSRLSIIDLSTAANQPMISPRTGCVLAFNGEIYNHREIRGELVKLGVTFCTDHSDTETLLEAIGYWGIEQAIDRVIGMFSFALYDPRSCDVYLARDRIGIKPLYICKLRDQWLFASEAKALFAHPKVEPALDLDAFSQYLSFRFVPAPRSLFQGVEKIEAGQICRISLKRASCKVWRYWNPLESTSLNGLSRSEAVEVLEDLLRSSVRYRLESDVPVGILLSGGVDSSLTMKLAGECGGTNLHSYTIRYPGFEHFDESDEARSMAMASGLHHHEVTADEDDFAMLMADVAYFQDEPIAAPVCLPVFLLARAARRDGVPVVLAGEGADELFIGYETWLALRTVEKWNQRIPASFRSLFQLAVNTIAAPMLPRSHRVYDLLVRIGRRQPVFWGGAMDFSRRERDSLLGPATRRQAIQDEFEAVISPIREEFLKSRPPSDVTGWMTYLDLRYRLPELMLPRLDKMGMAHGVEGRVPFLDHRLAEFALALPPALHENSSRVGKSLLKEVATKHLPKEMVYKRKRGFQAPVVGWKGSSSGAKYLDALRRFSRETGLLNAAAVESVVQRKDSRLYFNLVNFMLWYVTFVENPVADLIPSARDFDRVGAILGR